jgi:hypothetical protein
MRNRFVDDNGETVIAHRGNVWRFDSPTKEIIDDILANTGVFYRDPDVTDWDDIETFIREERPDIFIGTITDDNFLKSASYDLSHSSVSPLVKQLVNHLKLNGFKTSFDGESEDVRHTSELIGNYPDFAYHGTNLFALGKIIKYGLSPSQDNKNNWPFRFNDKIFLTVDKVGAMFHANNSARKQQTHPVILKIKIPDKTKITIDYDVAKMYGIEKDLDKEGYAEVIARFDKSPQDLRRLETIKKYSPKTDFTKVAGIFAYKGRIPANYIEWIGYKNDYDSKNGLNTDNLNILDDKKEWPKFVQMMNEHDFYDPDWEDEDEDQDY